MKADLPEEFGNFGNSVAISGATMLIGSPGWDGDVRVRNRFGAAFVYVRSGEDQWHMQARLEPHNAEALDQFGHQVALDGDTAVVIAVGEDSSATGIGGDGSDNDAFQSGAAYVFVREGSQWIQQAYIKAPSALPGHNLGHALALHEDTLVIADIRDSSGASGVNGTGTLGAVDDSGAAYVYVRNGETWSLQAYLKAPYPGRLDQFGHSVSIHGDTIAIGANREDASRDHDGIGDNNELDESGAAYVFERVGDTWTQQAYIKGANSEAGDSFGNSVALYGDTLVVGASNDNGGTGDPIHSSGAVYVYGRNGSAWELESYFAGNNTLAGDRFGSQLALEGDTLLVGATREDGMATGVDGPEGPRVGRDSGAAYVFTRSGDGWEQKAYLKASFRPIRSENLGRSLGISGDLIVVGSNGEEHDASGLNGTPSGEEISSAGAAYVYEKLADTTVRFKTISRETNRVRLEVAKGFRCPLGVEYSPDLSEGSWVELGNVFFGVAHEPGVFIDADPARLNGPRGYYRTFVRPGE